MLNLVIRVAPSAYFYDQRGCREELQVTSSLLDLNLLESGNAYHNRGLTTYYPGDIEYGLFWSFCQYYPLAWFVENSNKPLVLCCRCALLCYAIRTITYLVSAILCLSFQLIGGDIRQSITITFT